MFKQNVPRANIIIEPVTIIKVITYAVAQINSFQYSYPNV